MMMMMNKLTSSSVLLPLDSLHQYKLFKIARVLRYLLRFLKVKIRAASKNSGGIRNVKARQSAIAIADR